MNSSLCGEKECKNILIFSWLYPPSKGGLETVVSAQAKGLSSKGWSVTVITSGEKSFEINKENKVEVIRSKYFSIREKKLDLLRKYIRVAVKGKHFDIIHTHNISVCPQEYASIVFEELSSLETRMIEQCHDARKKHLSKKTLSFKWDLIITVSRFVSKRIKEKGVNSRKLIVLPNFVDLDLFDPDKLKSTGFFKSIPTDKKIILFPGRVFRPKNGLLNRQKQFRTLLLAAGQLKRKRNDFLLVAPTFMGTGYEESKIKRSVKRLRVLAKKHDLLENMYFFEKEIPFEKMPELYSLADIVCQPSIEEAMGLVFFEAMAMEKPVIGARSGGTIESIVEGENGFLIKPYDYKYLSTKLNLLLDDDLLCKRFGVNGRKRCKSFFSYSLWLNELNDIYAKFYEN